MAAKDEPSTRKDMDERVAIPLPFDDAMRSLLKVDPKSLPRPENGKRAKRATKPKK